MEPGLRVWLGTMNNAFELMCAEVEGSMSGPETLGTKRF